MSAMKSRSTFQFYVLLVGLIDIEANISPGNDTEIRLLSNNYVFDPLIGAEKDALTAYIDICGTERFCSSAEHRYRFKPRKWTCHVCPPCSCKTDCDFYGTCCPDEAISKSNLATIDRGELLQDSAFMSCREYMPGACETVERYDKNNPLRVIMIDKCPPFYANTSVKKKCESDDDLFDTELIFQVSSKENNLTYRNVYCALCHGIDDSNVEFWIPRIKVMNVSAAAESKTMGNIWRQVINKTGGFCVTSSTRPKEARPEWCWWSERVVNWCNATGKWSRFDPYVATMCHKPLISVIVVKKGLTYKNVYCAACNGELSEILDGCTFHGITSGTFSFASLIDFNPKQVFEQPPPKPSSNFSLPSSCGNNKVFNPLTGNCTSGHCESRFRYDSHGKKCEMLFPWVKGLGYKLLFRFELVKGVIKMTSDTFFNRFKQEIEWRLRGAFGIFEVNPFVLITEISDSDDEPDSFRNLSNIKAVNVSMNLKTQDLKNFEEFERKLDDIFSGTWRMFTFSKQQFRVTDIDACELDYFNQSRVNNSRGLYYSGVLSSRNKCTNKCPVTDYVPYKTRIDCPFLSYDVSSVITVHDSNGTLIKIGNYTIKNVTELDYKICGSLIKICASALRKAVLHISNDERITATDNSIANDWGLIIVSIVATTLSLVGNLLTFMTYCLFKELRTLPGLNTMALIANLFSAQIVFQMGIKPTGDENVCRFLGIAIHYLWMSSFAWMVVCAFHMFLVFRDVMAASAMRAHKLRFILYVILGNVVPAFIPAACILYHHFDTGERNFGYGGRICFLNSPTDIAYFFAAPLGLVLLLNVSFFSSTVYFLMKMPDMTSSVNQTNRGYTWVYVKMSSLMGFTWILGLIAATTQNTILFYLFTIVNGSQGVFIFVAYCVKRNIINSYSKLLRGKPLTSSSAGSGSNTVQKYSLTLKDSANITKL